VPDSRAALSVSLLVVERVEDLVAAVTADVRDSERRRCVRRSVSHQASHCRNFRYASSIVSGSHILEARQMFSQVRQQFRVVRPPQC
jgi:hypothetical protein